ncbi:MAG TPA: 1,4-dihydroxy-6-naphthoate synthase [Bacteroidales bacterium]|nr:1,4-dihydroxy-6-naphthoate synthase [Bacteroidales bacterium]HSA42916.1 1,4-dihydroxy-6-naphthoate synthase [Bacteroidales bacterium]
MNDSAFPQPLSLGFSPCPNDTYIFGALAGGMIATGGLSFDFTIADVEELNQLALAKKIDVTKVSFGAYLHLCRDYVLLNAGAALGLGVGPLLVAREPIPAGDFSNMTVAVPGLYTTANLLLGYAFPQIKNRQPVLFSMIEDAVLAGSVDAGVIIHESRFTYERKGLLKLADLGELWEEGTGGPVPLGGIVAKRTLPLSVIAAVEGLIRSSLSFAVKNREALWPYIQYHARESTEDVIQSHIGLYVNQYTEDLGETGRKAVLTMLQYGVKSGLIPELPADLFRPV